MAIIALQKNTVIRPGQFFCPASSARGAICGYPRKVTRVSGSRIYYLRENESEERRMTRCSGYLCDTFEEGEALAELGLERLKAMEIAEREARARVIAEFKPRVSALVSPSPAPGPAAEPEPLGAGSGSGHSEASP